MLAPLPPNAWTLEHAAHLLNRAGFGGTPGQIRAFHQLGLPRAIDAVFAGSGPQLPPPGWTQEPVSSRKQIDMDATGISPDEKREAIKAAAKLENVHVRELRSWWVERMHQNRQPLLEKMTLFWHGHFATSIVKVKSAWQMWRQNETLRTHALGNFGTMLQAMTRDPAMIRWLDLQRSKVGEPNENFAREVLELFTLGEGNYTEQDIKEGARAFTGLRINRETQEFVFVRRAHDHGTKTFLGRTGDFGADDIVRLILARHQCARFVASRVWEYFAYEDPEPGVREVATATFRKSGYEIQPLLRSIFQSQAFYSKRALRTQIKAPVDWLVNTCIVIGAPVPRQPALDFILNRLGQLPFAPPNVRGWEGGKSWISSSTLVLRYNLAGWLLGNPDKETRRLVSQRQQSTADMGQVAPPALRDQPEALAHAMVFRLFGTPNLPKMQARALEAIAASPKPMRDADARAISQNLMSTPDFQLT
jgi:uncharacterized protein (DUF1800 family)